MKRKSPTPVRQVPVDFGDEPLCSVPIRRDGGLCRRKGFTAPTLYPGRFQAPRFNGLTLQRFNALLFNRKSQIANRKWRRGFTLVEILVVLVLLSLIVFALMAVFSGTQKAFRASLTQTDTLEGGRAVMDLIAGDLATMTPCDYDTNVSANLSPVNFLGYAPVNFYVSPKAFPAGVGPPAPLYQSLIGSSTLGLYRTNVLEDIFVLSRTSINGVPNWVGTGYSVTTNLSDGALYPLYRFYMTSPVSAGPTGEALLFTNFFYFAYTNTAIWSHLMDGVVNLTARAYDTNGVWMTNGYANPNLSHVRFVRFHPDASGGNTLETYCAFYSNAVPASVQIELGTLEDRVLAHAEGLSGIGQSNYLGNSSSQVHLFRQRVWIRNLDITAYQ